MSFSPQTLYWPLTSEENNPLSQWKRRISISHYEYFELEGVNLSNASDLLDALVRSFVFPHTPDWIPSLTKTLEDFLALNPSMPDILSFINHSNKELYRCLLYLWTKRLVEF